MPDQLSDIELSAILLLSANKQQNAAAAKGIGHEQLIAVAAGDLSTEERETILAAVAADDNLYHFWLGLLELSSELGAPDTQTASVNSRQKPSFLERLSEWLNPGKLVWLAGPALAASLVMLMLPTGKTPFDADQLYDRWGLAIQPSSAGSYSGFRGDASEPAVKDTEQQWFEWGVYSGLKKLGDGYVITGLPDYKLQNSKPDNPIPSGESLTITGKVLVLTYFFCQQDMELAFLDDVLEVTGSLGNIPVEQVTGSLENVPVEQVAGSLGNVPAEWSLISNTLGEKLDRSGGIEIEICTRTNTLIKKLIFLND
ncbi:MAG: hypothetical protein CL797_05495 [Chromatiales bacterium]|nr:hypothetical protein [Chromatiales bacterium]